MKEIHLKEIYSRVNKMSFLRRFFHSHQNIYTNNKECVIFFKKERLNYVVENNNEEIVIIFKKYFLYVIFFT